jgi:iron complex outermembrane receptor protein
MTPDRFQFRPERSTNYEAGVKSVLADGRVQANLAIFDMKFKDLQQSAYDPDRRTFLTRNAARASSKGAELDLEWLPLNELQLSANVAYLDAKFDDYPGAPCLATETLAQCNSADPASLAAHNVKGLPLQFAPKWSGNIGARYTRDVMNDLRLVATDNALFRRKNYDADGYSPIWGLQDGWVKLDARIQIGPADDRWHVALVGRNLTDEHTVGAAIRFPGSITAVTRTQNWMDEYRSVAIEGAFKVF